MSKRLNKEKIIGIIQEDANLRCKYFLGEKACVIGGLCLAANIPPALKKQVLRTCNSNFITGLAGGFNNKAKQEVIETLQEFLTENYGLTKGELRRLQKINDGCKKTVTRRERLIAAVQRMKD